MELFSHYLVVDLEATCSQDGTIPRKSTEIIEIGAVMVKADSFEFVGQFQSFVRPVRSRFLTPFCCTLTSISQSDVDTAPYYGEVFWSFIDWAQQFDDFVFCSWGAYDRYQLLQDCEHHRLAYPFGERHINLKTEFAKRRGCRSMGFYNALKELGISPEGTHHRGIDDARNTARMLPFILSTPYQPNAK